ncbi:hypothetical protein [Streptomyces sp. NPDC060194]|uniref:hypothetical protein n=1 Tax=Streptomyces sp. NPDC060194 TaxID=3347069 RepID=UPI003647C46F
MSSSDTAYAPIYDDLIEEFGDVLAESREAAEETNRASEEALDWSDLKGDRRDV